MKLPGPIEERLDVLHAQRCRLLRETDAIALEDAGVRVEGSLDGATTCIQLRLKPEDIQFLRGAKCADFALLLARGADVYEAHVYELTKTVALKKWDTVQEQLEWAIVRLLAIAGVLGIEIAGVAVYTAYIKDDLSREGSANPAFMKLPVEPALAETNDARRWAEGRRSWESGRLRMEILGQDVEHRRIPGDAGGRAAVVCRARSSDGDRRWLFEPVAG